MKTSLSPDEQTALLEPLDAVEAKRRSLYPGEPEGRQPVHTVYGGAHLFRRDIARKLGDSALNFLDHYASDPLVFARAVGLVPEASLEGHTDLAMLRHVALEAPETARKVAPRAAMAVTVYDRMREKLRREPVEDFRIDFEDGYGNRSDNEEDGHALAAADELGEGQKAGLLPPFIGIRIKPLTSELRDRAVRTLDLVVTRMVERAGGSVPGGFVVTLPKVTSREEVRALVRVLRAMEQKLALPERTLKFELMIETTQAIVGSEGSISIRGFVDEADGRCVGAHFGTYDYTASCNITARHQHMRNAVCDFAKHVMQVSLSGTGIFVSDGATNVMPVPVHRGDDLTPEQHSENVAVVHRAMRLHYDNVQHSLVHGYYQGWDLHPAQLPTRYAAMFAFFLDGLFEVGERLRNFVEKSARATLVGDVFDDAATGQGLLNFFLRAAACGAITEEEAVRLSGLELEELRGRSFIKILNARRRQAG